MHDPSTGRPLFTTRCIELCCEKCKVCNFYFDLHANAVFCVVFHRWFTHVKKQEEGKSHECVHMLHLVPSWQSEERHRKLKIMMQDRPDLIQSELAGLAFDSLQQVFRKGDIHLMFETTPWPLKQNQQIWIVIDPAAGGPQSDYAVVSICREKGCVQVFYASRYRCLHSLTNQ